MDYLTTHKSLAPIWRGLAPGFVNSHEGCTRLATDKVYQLLAHGRFFSPRTLASSTTKTGRHDIAEILLKVVIKHQKIKSNQLLLQNRPIRTLCMLDNDWLFCASRNMKFVLQRFISNGMLSLPLFMLDNDWLFCTSRNTQFVLFVVFVLCTFFSYLFVCCFFIFILIFNCFFLNVNFASISSIFYFSLI